MTTNKNVKKLQIKKRPEKTMKERKEEKRLKREKRKLDELLLR